MKRTYISFGFAKCAQCTRFCHKSMQTMKRHSLPACKALLLLQRLNCVLTVDCADHAVC